jgi:hypothetical protein
MSKYPEIVNAAKSAVLAAFVADRLLMYLTPGRGSSAFTAKELDQLLDDAFEFAASLGIRDEAMGGTVEGYVQKALITAIGTLSARDVPDLPWKLKKAIAGT